MMRGTNVVSTVAADLADRPPHRVPIGRGQRRTPGILIRDVWDHAVCRERPERAADVAFDGRGERGCPKSVQLGGEALEGGVVLVLFRLEQLRLNVRQRRTHPD